VSRHLPTLLIVAGAVMVVVAIVGFVAGRGGGTAAPQASAAPTPGASVPAGSVTTAQVSTTLAPPPTTAFSTTASTTTTAATTSSTTAGTPATPADETVEGFVADFAAALATGDVDFVTARLHPDVVAAYGEALCRSWIRREIMTLSDYTLQSVDAGPRTRVLAFPDGDHAVDGVYDATVSFVFSGQAFTAPTNFALVDHQMFWLGKCR